ncbi:MAG: hypothetical protein AB7H80_08540 [Candidatus Kapaibacterium sp.]
MKIMHHIGSDWSREDVEMLRSKGVNVDVGIHAIQLEEDDLYSELASFFKEREVVNIEYAEFTAQELNEASLLFYTGTWENGYPQPKRNKAYLNATFDLSRYCSVCGIGKVQNAPFRIKSEPKWGKRKMFELFWEPDALFVESTFYETYLSPLGLLSKEVLIHKSEKVANSVVQVLLPDIDLHLDLSEISYENCTNCHRAKYSPVVRKPYRKRKELDVAAPSIFRGNNYFGSGGLAFKQIFISQEVRKQWIQLKATRQHQFVPVI